MRAFVLPAVAVGPTPMKTLPAAPAPLTGQQGMSERLDHRRISRYSILDGPVHHRPRGYPRSGRHVFVAIFQKKSRPQAAFWSDKSALDVLELRLKVVADCRQSGRQLGAHLGKPFLDASQLG